MTKKPPGVTSNSVDQQRTVHNVLYTASGSSGQTAQLQSPTSTHVYDYAHVSVGRDGDTGVQQHTLFHSTLNSSDEMPAGSHAYSKPTTPLSNYDRTANHFQAGASQGPGHLPAATAGGEARPHNYAKLNGPLVESHLDPGQLETEYSHIDEAHKYAKLSEANSKGYSQLETRHATGVPPRSNSASQEGQDFPYEVPFSPTSNSFEAARNHTYAVLEPPEVSGAKGRDYSTVEPKAEQNRDYAVLEPENENQVDSTLETDFENQEYSALQDIETSTKPVGSSRRQDGGDVRNHDYAVLEDVSHT